MLSIIVIPQGAGQNQTLNYQPAAITVVVGINNTIIWADHDSSSVHTVVSLSVPPGAQIFDSGNLVQEQNYVVTLTVPGTYTYHCIYHPWLTGTIIVLAGQTTTTTTSMVPTV